MTGRSRSRPGRRRILPRPARPAEGLPASPAPRAAAIPAPFPAACVAPCVALLLLALGPGPAPASGQQAPVEPVASPAPATGSGAAAGGARVGAGELRSLARGDDAVVVSVGDVELHRSDVFRVLDLAVPSRSAEVIRQMVLTTAAAMDAAREGIDVPAAALEAEVERAVSEQKASFAVEVDENMPLEEYLRLRHGLTPGEYHQEVRRMVLATLLLERAVRLSQLRVASDDLQVLVVEDADLARQLGDQLRAGASFAVLAKKHSIHPSAAQGGELPPVPRDEPMPLLAGREVLSPGDLLGPDPLTVGGRTVWRLMRLVDRHEADDRPWEALREEVEAGLTARGLTGDELALFEARVADRYRVSRPTSPP